MSGTLESEDSSDEVFVKLRLLLEPKCWKVAEYLLSGSKTVSELSTLMAGENSGETESVIDKLIDAGLVVRDRHGYRLEDQHGVINRNSQGAFVYSPISRGRAIVVHIRRWGEGMRIGEPSAVLVTGIQAAGKSTIGRMLAEHFHPGTFVEGDLMWKLIVSGRVDMTPDPHPEAIRQLRLRYRNGALLVDSLVSSRFTAVHADIILEDDMTRYVKMVQSRPLRVIVLAPDPNSVVERELNRGTNAYRSWIPEGKGLEDAVRTFQAAIDATPRIGIRIDSSFQTPEETLREILDRWDEAVV